MYGTLRYVVSSLFSGTTQFKNEARPHLCINEQKHSTPIHKWLSMTQYASGKPVGMVLTLGMKVWIADILLEYFVLFCVHPLGLADAHLKQAI